MPGAIIIQSTLGQYLCGHPRGYPNFPMLPNLGSLGQRKTEQETGLTWPVHSVGTVSLIRKKEIIGKCIMTKNIKFKNFIHLLKL